jgi:hypothetical protein
MKTRITITVRKGDKESVINILPKTLCKAADLIFMVDDCARCDRIFKLNRCHKEIYDVLEAIWTADEWAHAGRPGYQLVEKDGKTTFARMPKAEWKGSHLFKRPRWRKTRG